MTKHDAISAAMDLADDVAQGRVDPAELDASLEAACRDLMGTIAGPDDPLWALQVQIARGVLAAGGIEPDELAEWAAVGRRRAQGGLEPAEPADVPTDADSDATEAHSGENGTAPDDAEPADAAVQLVDVLAALAAEPEPEPTADPEPADTGCKCAAHTAKRGPKFGGTVLARGRGLPGQ
ncbi:flagellar hook-length control protein [Mycobacteroides abscessus]|uniref:flagellar hook-length control protein n=1 Tax=Mycobacteroides abscessus TaxID=36809 RepID=UPI003B3A690D